MAWNDLIKFLPPHIAKALADRFEFVFTPKRGSWLNITEIDVRKEIIVCHLCLIQFVIDYSTVSTYCQVFSKIDI